MLFKVLAKDNYHHDLKLSKGKVHRSLYSPFNLCQAQIKYQPIIRWDLKLSTCFQIYKFRLNDDDHSLIRRIL